MQRTLALLTLACGLCLAPCRGLYAPQRCEDASVLLQGATRQAPLNLMTAYEHQVASMKQTLGQLLRLAAAHGKEASKALGMLAEAGLAETESEGSGCNASDRTQLQLLMEKIPEMAHEMEGNVSAAMRKSANGPLVMPQPGDDLVLPTPKFELPKPCERALSSQGDLVSCVFKVTGLSRPCIRCVPQLVGRIERDCMSMCLGSFESMATASQGMAQPLIDELVAHPTNFNPDAPMKKMTKYINMALKQLVPCMRCVKPKLGRFGECVGGGFKSVLVDSWNGLLEDLRNGLDGNATVSISSGEDEDGQQGGQAPQVALAAAPGAGI